MGDTGLLTITYATVPVFGHLQFHFLSDRSCYNELPLARPLLLLS